MEQPGALTDPSLPSPCHLRYEGHVPGVAFTFGSTYGTTTLKYFQDHRNAALEKSHTPFSKGGHFPTIFSPNPNLVMTYHSRSRDRWLHTPSYTHFNLDGDRGTQLSQFYQVGCTGLGCLPNPHPGEGDSWAPGGCSTFLLFPSP